MIRCVGSMCVSTFPGDMESARVLGWQERGQFVFCPECSKSNTTSASVRIQKLERDLADARRELDDARQDIARLNAILDGRVADQYE